MNLKLNKTFKLIRKLGLGSFGEVFLEVNLKTKQQVAIKLESAYNKYSQLPYEAQLYEYLLHDKGIKDKGIPNLHYYFEEEDYNIMVMDLLGPSLEDFFNTCNRKFSLKTVLMVADQMIKTIEYVHSWQSIHRDIKLENILIGLGKCADKVYLIDFRLAKKYIEKDNKHIPYKEGKNLTSTARYASINSALGIQQSRRDDLEGRYVLLYFLRGSLPWQNMQANTKKGKHEMILEKKLGTSIDTLCEGCPIEFVTFLDYCRHYNYLRNLLKDLFVKSGFEMDYQYDWVILAKEKVEDTKDSGKIYL